MCFQKKQMEKEMEEQKQKLLRSEQSLQACQTKEQDLRKKMEVGWKSVCYNCEFAVLLLVHFSSL